MNIQQLENDGKMKDQKHKEESIRLNTEIERLNNILKATNGNMQE